MALCFRACGHIEPRHAPISRTSRGARSPAARSIEEKAMKGNRQSRIPRHPRGYRIGERVVLNYGMRGEIRERLGEGRYAILRADRVLATYSEDQFRKAEPN
jgi:hypothetical protein